MLRIVTFRYCDDDGDINIEALAYASKATSNDEGIDNIFRHIKIKREFYSIAMYRYCSRYWGCHYCIDAATSAGFIGTARANGISWHRRVMLLPRAK